MIRNGTSFSLDRLPRWTALVQGVEGGMVSSFSAATYGNHTSSAHNRTIS